MWPPLPADAMTTWSASTLIMPQAVKPSVGIGRRYVIAGTSTAGLMYDPRVRFDVALAVIPTSRARLGDQTPSRACRSPSMGLSGVEPLTSRLSGVRSNHLSYRPLMCCNDLRRSAGALTLWCQRWCQRSPPVAPPADHPT